jgi:putative ABC transport system permease protein
MNEPPRFNFFRLVTRNLKNHPHRNIAMIVTFAIIAATLFSAQYLISGAENGLDQGTAWIGADLIVVPEDYTAKGENSMLTGSPSMFFFNDSGFEQIFRIPGVSRASPQILVATLAGQSCCSGFVQLIAIDPEHDFTLAPWLEAHPGVMMGKGDIIVGSKIDGEIGSDLKFYGHIFHMAGKLDPTGMMGVDMAVFTRIDDVYSMADESGVKAVQTLVIPKGMVSSVLVRVEPGASPAEVGSEIRKSIPGTRTITPTGLLATVTLHLAGITRLLFGSVGAVTLLSVPLIGLMSAMVAHELKREIALLGALGVTKAFILQLLLAESFTSSVIGSLIGIGSAAVILISFQDFITFSLEIPFSIAPPLTLIAAAGSTLLLTLVISGIDSLYPTIRIVRSEAYRNIRDIESV